MIFTIANQKGGVAKTTTALALASGLAREGRKVLLIDLDAQANSTTTLRAKTKQGSTYELLTGQKSLSEILQETNSPNLWIAPASGSLATADIDIKGTGRESKLRLALAKAQFDDVVIDTPPALGILTINALVASGSLIVPTTLDSYSLDAIRQVIENYKRVKLGDPRKNLPPLNTDLNLEGFLITRYTRANISRELVVELESMAQKQGSKVFSSHIRESVKAREAHVFRETIFDYSPKSTTALDYKNFIKEVLNNG